MVPRPATVPRVIVGLIASRSVTIDTRTKVLLPMFMIGKIVPPTIWPTLLRSVAMILLVLWAAWFA